MRVIMEKKADIYQLKATIGKSEEIYLELKAEGIILESVLEGYAE